MIPPQKDSSSLLFRCQKSATITAQLTQFFADHQAPIQTLIQHLDEQQQLFRIEWAGDTGWTDKTNCLKDFANTFGGINSEQSYSIRLAGTVPTVGLMCSERTHVLDDVLHRLDSEYYPEMKVLFIISDQEAVANVADRHRVPFFHVSKAMPPEETQRRQLEIIERYSPDILGLASYDARLSKRMIERARCLVLSVHNTLLPSVKSEKAYSMAYQKGLKLLGATAEIVQAEAIGPLVTQDVAKLWPGMSLNDIRLVGRDLERKVFAEALRKLVEHKVMVYNAKTIVFD